MITNPALLLSLSITALSTVSPFTETVYMLSVLVLFVVVCIVANIQTHKTLGILQCTYISISVGIVMYHRIYDTKTENSMVFVSHALCAAAFASAGEQLKRV